MSQAARYYVPEPSRWPIFGSIALLLMALLITGCTAELPDAKEDAPEGNGIFDRVAPEDADGLLPNADGGARVLVLITPAGLEHMFIEGGIPLGDAGEPPPQHYDMERVLALATKYGWDIIGPPMA